VLIGFYKNRSLKPSKQGQLQIGSITEKVLSMNSEHNVFKMVLDKLRRVAYDKVDGASRVPNSATCPVMYFFVNETTKQNLFIMLLSAVLLKQ